MTVIEYCNYWNVGPERKVLEFNYFYDAIQNRLIFQLLFGLQNYSQAFLLNPIYERQLSLKFSYQILNLLKT